jgi:hypothetical protein
MQGVLKKGRQHPVTKRLRVMSKAERAGWLHQRRSGPVFGVRTGSSGRLRAPPFLSRLIGFRALILVRRWQEFVRVLV